ncbi:phosphomannomutase [Enterobacter cancerogenus]|uniref:phosphomannomutase n=1 Tax=Enterobacter cancerogenus TaxID=69218 RepID=UPI00381CEDCF
MNSSLMTCSNVLHNNPISFGTSGARGLVVDFTNELCAAFTHAFLDVVSKEFDFEKVALAIDNRPSSYDIVKACAAAIKQHGYKVEFHGVIPTPALAYYAMHQNIPCIMVTGSHIPFDRNGLKFYRPDGEITKKDEIDILNSDYKFKAINDFNDFNDFNDLPVNHEGARNYIKRYTSLFDSLILSGLRIGIYEHSSAGRDLYASIFGELGAEVIPLGRSDDFVPIDTEAVSNEDRQLAKEWSKEYNLDVIFSTDGDGDRPLISDENGEWLRGDILGLLASIALGIEAVAVPVSCNTAIELSLHFKSIIRTKIGSPYVIEAFNDLKTNYASVAGFEANGGYLLATDLIINEKQLLALPTRDAVLPAIMLLVAAQGGNISKLVHLLPHRFTWSDRLKDFPTELTQRIIASAIKSPDQFISDLGLETRKCSSIDQTDGLRFVLDNGDVIHLRPSGNAPELRCYTEASEENQAKNYIEVILSKFVTIKS